MSKVNVSRQGRDTKSPRTTILIFTEGEVSEPQYIKKLGPYKGNVDVRLSDKHGIGTLEHFIKDCDQSYDIDYNKNIKAKISTVWLVFDYDDRADAHKYVRKIENGKELICDGEVRDFGLKEVKSSFTSMCIEYWVLLHFTDHDGSPVYRTTDSHKSTRLIHLINEEIRSYNEKYHKSIPQYGKTDDWLEKVWPEFEAINPENPLRFISPKPRIVEAYVRAKKIAESKI